VKQLFERPYTILLLLVLGASPAGVSAGGLRQDQDSSAPSPAQQQPPPSTTTAHPGKPAAKPSTTSKSGTAKTGTAHKTTAKGKRRASPRVTRMKAAFVASADLKPMARQLLDDHTPAAYAGVELYAQKHAKEDAGSLAWLVVGYARFTDHDLPRAIDALNRAKPHAGDLGDYVAYYLGSAYVQSGHASEAIATLADFGKTYSDSLLTRDADIMYAAALNIDGRSQDAIAILEPYRDPLRADVELSLGRAYEATGQNAKAAIAFRNLYFNLPTSGEADTAAGELHKIGVGTQGSATERRTRAELLAKGKRYNDAANEYKDLADEVPPAERVSVLLAEASVLQKGNRYRDSRPVLQRIPDSTPENDAQKLYLLGEAERASGDEDAFLRAVAQLRQAAPASSWLEQSLLSAGNMYLVKRDYDRAIDFYRELEQRFPQSAKASYSHWKIAWLSLRQSRVEDAKKGFEQQIALYPVSNEVPAALYWRGRLAEEDGETMKARAFYQKLSDRYRNYYYAELARDRMRSLKATGEPVHYALLDRVPALNTPGKMDVSEPPADDLHVQKAHLLENGALLDFAVREIQAAGANAPWVPAEVARIYSDSGRYDRAIGVMKRTVPSYFAVDIPELPRPYWEALFPKAYWNDLKRFSAQNDLDPYLVASLIRQESEFNPNAISHANAVGLMQLLPGTGKKVAKDLKIHHFTPSQLYTPTMNLQLGTRYFKSMVDRFGSFEYALAAYNAGADRVEDWKSQGKYRDTAEFVESIPFTETREYVQAIVRNTNVYKQLYEAR
jgi:soluble lytic murein transglycosylase